MNEATTLHTDPPRTPAQLAELVARLAAAMAHPGPVTPAHTDAARARLVALGTFAGGLLVGALTHGVQFQPKNREEQ